MAGSGAWKQNDRNKRKYAKKNFVSVLLCFTFVYVSFLFCFYFAYILFFILCMLCFCFLFCLRFVFVYVSFLFTFCFLLCLHFATFVSYCFLFPFHSVYSIIPRFCCDAELRLEYNCFIESVREANWKRNRKSSFGEFRREFFMFPFVNWINVFQKKLFCSSEYVKFVHSLLNKFPYSQKISVPNRKKETEKLFKVLDDGKCIEENLLISFLFCSLHPKANPFLLNSFNKILLYINSKFFCY